MNKGTVVGAGVGVAVIAGIYIALAARFHIQAPPVQLDPLYCPTLAQTASGLSSVDATWALFATLATIIMATAAIVWGNDTAETGLTKRYRGTILQIGAMIMGLLGFFLYRRSDAATELAAAANDARLQDGVTDQSAFNVCSRAWSAWVRSRLDSNAIGRAAAEEALRGKDDRVRKLDDSLQQTSQSTAKTAEAAENLAKALKTIPASQVESRDGGAAGVNEVTKLVNQAASAAAQARLAADVAQANLRTAAPPPAHSAAH